MTNEQRATQIAGNNLVRYYEQGSSYEECYQSAFEAMEWKDEQHEQEKQQWIEKAWKFLDDLCDRNFLKKDDVFDRFKKEMEK